MLHYKGYDILTRTLHAQGPAVSVTAYIVRRGETVVHRGTVRGPFYSEGVAHFAAEAAASEWIDGSRQVRGPSPMARARRAPLDLLSKGGDTAVMAASSPSWLFICSPYKTWTWRSPHSAASEPLPSLNAATADAKTHGFDPFTQYWIASVGGYITHYRPGKNPLNLPSGQEPQD